MQFVDCVLLGEIFEHLEGAIARFGSFAVHEDAGGPGPDIVRRSSIALGIRLPLEL